MNVDTSRRTGAPELHVYDLGKTPIRALSSDTRFAYCLYVPPSISEGGAPPELLVVQHGTGRGFTDYRDDFAAFARWHNVMILAPLFPVGPQGDGNRDGFKYMIEGDIRYDHVLLSMVDEVAERYGCDFSKFALFGYSGGGHFAHRFLMLHADRLFAVSIGAPGSVTLLDPTRDWWVGTRNFAEIFGKEIDIEKMKQVKVQMLVGKVDLETWEITHKVGGKYWMPDANHAGKVRPERLDSLRRSFEQSGIEVRFDLIPNMGHDGRRAVGRVEEFMDRVLAERRDA
ncbi:alpha/beta hydrolase [Paracoccus onubensis]|uniref:alpha/beta hydrolase family protein n=1 Tax=Paracoccus onubensis TaxID=1675788 RepID=UPI00272EF01B|nr:alpha/beta hydrolase [Paracoccus onubensis]MDP0929684.1 alpha/beta hydrolase [Paracoccus onubensis]